VLPKAQRLQIFFERLQVALPADSAEKALELLATTLNCVEDEFSGIKNRPESWQSDARMYPPQLDSRVKNPQSRSTWKFRNKGHYTFIGNNGAIRIETVEGDLLFQKAGHDGLFVDEETK
jgi:hypothetical protein